MADDDLAALFPNLASTLDNWDGRQANDTLPSDPSHAGVTDEQIEAELRRMGALRAPLSPLVSGQTPPPTPEFYNNGRMAPPASRAVVEPPQAPAEPPADDDTADGDAVLGTEEESDESPPTVPTIETRPQPTAPPPVEVAGRQYDRQQIEAWAQFDAILGADAELRSLVQQHLQRRQQGLPSATPPVDDAPPPLPTLPPHYEDDETIKALYRTVQAQQSLLDRTVRESRQALTTASHQVQRTYVDIAQGAMSEFQRAKNLDDNTMSAVMRAVSQSGLANQYMRGVDPLTGESTVDPAVGSPDPYKAMMRSLDIAYYMVPETRQAEVDREIASRVERARKDTERKQKLAGVSGAAGSVPRTQSVPADPNDRYSAMVEEMRQMQNGSWVGDGSN